MFHAEPRSSPREQADVSRRGPLGAEHRQTIAHGVSRGSHVRKDHQPQRGGTPGRSQGRKAAKQGEANRNGATEVNTTQVGQCPRQASEILRLFAILAAQRKPVLCRKERKKTQNGARWTFPAHSLRSRSEPIMPTKGPAVRRGGATVFVAGQRRVFQPRWVRHLGVKMSFGLEGGREYIGCSQAVSGTGEATQFLRSRGKGFLSPRWGWDSIRGRNPVLTRWAIV